MRIMKILKLANSCGFFMFFLYQKEDKAMDIRKLLEQVKNNEIDMTEVEILENFLMRIWDMQSWIIIENYVRGFGEVIL